MGSALRHQRTAAPVGPTAGAATTLRPLPLSASQVVGGFWARRQQVNRTAAIPAGLRRLRENGSFRNLRRAAGQDQGPFEGPPFIDSDTYKWLEAIAWEQGRLPSQDLAAEQAQATALIAAAQQPDGYVNSYVQVVTGGAARFTDLARSHELYCAGHLIQAAVAQHRATRDRKLLEVAVRFGDLLATTFGPGKRSELDGHPLIEMALVELYRETGATRYLELARHFVEARGHGWAATGPEPRPRSYYADRVPVRAANTVEGHAVRALYLAAGAADLAAETGDDELLTALRRQWEAMVATKMYITGGLGSRWDGEAFGDPYELPPARAYCETCAAIASIQWAWRMLLRTGDARYADLIERQLYNAFLPGVSLDGTAYLYTNALQVRSGAADDEPRNPANGRAGWFGVACCPPNIMRTMVSEPCEPGTYLRLRRRWAAGDSVVLDLPMPVRRTVAHERVDAVRGCVAVERGPLVYCLEQADHPADVLVDDIRLVGEGTAVWKPDLLEGVTVIEMTGRTAPERAPLYQAQTAGTGQPGNSVRLTAIPYFAWANRGPGPMRVWIPLEVPSGRG